MASHVTIEYDRREPGVDVIPGLEPRYEDPEIEIAHLPDDRGPELEPQDLRGVDPYVSYAYDLTAASLAGVDSLKLATRSGAGFENFDLDAMTEHGVIATHAPQGPTASAARATTGMIIPCAHNVPRMEHGLRERGREVTPTTTGSSSGTPRSGSSGWASSARRRSRTWHPSGPTARRHGCTTRTYPTSGQRSSVSRRSTSTHCWRRRTSSRSTSR